MESLNNICPIAHRRYEEVPIEKVKVINSRNRDKEQFDMNVESIGGVGLMKPIRVNDKFLESAGHYELICGEGRLLAHQQLGKTHVMAEVVSCTRKEALLQSLIENIARTKPGSMDFARELKRSDNDIKMESASIVPIKRSLRCIRPVSDYLAIGRPLAVQPVSHGRRANTTRPMRSNCGSSTCMRENCLSRIDRITMRN